VNSLLALVIGYILVLTGAKLAFKSKRNILLGSTSVVPVSILS